MILVKEIVKYRLFKYVVEEMQEQEQRGRTEAPSPFPEKRNRGVTQDL